MRKISSEATFFYKRFFPSLYFGFLIFILIILILATNNKTTVLFPLIVIILMIVIGFAIFRASVFGIADEVLDFGDHLLFKQNGIEIQIFLKSIQEINYRSGRQLRLDVSLKKECELGRKLSFYPAGFRIVGSPKNPTGNTIADELISKVRDLNQL